MATSSSTVGKLIEQMAQYVKEASYLVVFTGAGISTSTGLPDYRGENGLRSRKRSRSRPNFIPDLHQLRPSPTHMALNELYHLGYVKYIVSQNVDNLHRKSGIPADSISELHGNATTAKCDTCGFLYEKDFPIHGFCTRSDCASTSRSLEQRMKSRTRHGSGRLRRHVLEFGDEILDIEKATPHCEKADVALVLGTSLRVEPFASLATDYAQHIVIVNKGPTTSASDQAASVRIDQDCDSVMTQLMRCLLSDPNYTVPEYQSREEERHDDVFVSWSDEGNEYMGNVLAGRR